MKEIPNCYYRISVKGLILDKDKKFLLCKEDNEYWEFPGGGLDFGEDAHTCLKREIKGEMGLEVTSIGDHPVYFLTRLNRKKVWVANVFYVITVKDLRFTPSDECVEIGFFTKDEALDKNLYNSVADFTKLYDPSRH